MRHPIHHWLTNNTTLIRLDVQQQITRHSIHIYYEASLSYHHTKSLVPIRHLQPAQIETIEKLRTVVLRPLGAQILRLS